MHQKTTGRFAPQQIEDVVFAAQANEQYFLSLRGRKTFDDLLLYGPPGMGKSTLAQLVPAIIEPDVVKGDVINFDCYEFRSIDEVQKRISRPIKFVSQSDRFYVILEEADGLSRDALASLKTTMDVAKHHAMFIFVTNNENKINDAIRSRCREVYIGMPAAEQWLPRVRSIIYRETGKTVPDNSLLDVIRCAKDGRAVIRYCAELIERISARGTSV